MDWQFVLWGPTVRFYQDFWPVSVQELLAITNKFRYFIIISFIHIRPPPPQAGGEDPPPHILHSLTAAAAYLHHKGEGMAGSRVTRLILQS